MSQEEPSDRKPDPWPLSMAGHAQLKFVMTECHDGMLEDTNSLDGAHVTNVWNNRIQGCYTDIGEYYSELG